MARRLTPWQRAKQTRAAVQRRLSEIPPDDGWMRFGTEGTKNYVCWSPQRVHDYKAEKMRGFDDLPRHLRDRLNEHNR